ncbi:hypothetical protein PQR34_46320 [Paraburkholderia sediminicola]|uniref:hypothetical protein n=1 Tax=Paraburkholderia sediminicola TaxID=458836 RepID=UPI0038B8910D
MVTIIVSLIQRFWPAITGVFGLGGIGLFAWLKTKSANTKVAQAEAREAVAKEQVAETLGAVERANADAAAAGEQALANRLQADAGAAALGDDELDAALARQGALRKDPKP